MGAISFTKKNYTDTATSGNGITASDMNKIENAIVDLDTAVTSLQDSVSQTNAAAIVLKAYPVGAIYISYYSTSPASLFGGTWLAITGRFPYFDKGTSTGGSNTHTLTAGQLADHKHWIGLDQDAYYAPSSNSCYTVHKSGNESSSGYGTWAWSAGMGDMSGTEVYGQSHNNMPAYQTLYAWRRTN